MRKISRLLLIMITLIIMAPSIIFAAPKGYMEVKLTKKNFTKYWGTKKIKKKDAFGDYDGYEFRFYSKLLKKGYYLYEADSCAVQYSGKSKSKWKYKKKWYKGEWTLKRTNKWEGRYWIDTYIDGAGSDYDYKYAKLSKFKIKKVKGKLIFVKPSNIIGIKKEYDKKKLTGYTIKLKYPYDKNTDYSDHWDDNLGKSVVDYYYITRDLSDIKFY